MGDSAIQQYYGETLTSQRDLKTGACCSPEAMPAYLQDWLREIPREVTDRFYGCGSPIPAAATGATVVDLGCGTGRDAFLASRLVGPAGRVIGIDMTPEMIGLARKNAKEGGIANVEFHQSTIDRLPLPDASVDCVISNCVINLAPDKPAVFREIARVAGGGGGACLSCLGVRRRRQRLPKRHLYEEHLYNRDTGNCTAGVDFHKCSHFVFMV